MKDRRSRESQIFIWVFAHDMLLTNYTKNRMGMGHSMCHYCGNIMKTSLHVLMDCPTTMQIWPNVAPSNIMNNFFHVDLKYWIYLNLNYKWSETNEIQWRHY